MGISASRAVVNTVSAPAVRKILFPAPNPPHYEYTSFSGELLWLPPKQNITSYVPIIFMQNYDSNKLMIFAHGNGCDIGSMYPLLKHLSKVLTVNVLAIDYPGYGQYLGTTSGQSIDDTMDYVWNFVINDLKWSSENVFFYGQSIGTGPVCDLTAKLQSNNIAIGGIILHSPYTSLPDVFQLAPDLWKSLDNIKKITCPVLFMHGKKDTLITWHHSQKLFDVCESKHKTLHYQETAGHNDMDYELIIPKIKKFLASNMQANKKFKCATLNQKLFYVPETVIDHYLSRNSVSSSFSS